MSIRLNLNKPKIIKTGLGVLINLSVEESNKEILATDPTFYQLLYQVLDTYLNQKLLMDYAIKLI